MLVLTRKMSQEIVIGDNITVTVLEYRQGQVRLGITAPKEIPIHRKEVRDAIERQNAQTRKDHQHHTGDTSHVANGAGRSAGKARSDQAA